VSSTLLEVLANWRKRSDKALISHSPKAIEPGRDEESLLLDVR
jgi:hypothetical protein